MATLGDRLRHLRIERNLTQEEVGKSIGTTKQQIYKYETGIIENVPADKIEALANLYDVSPAYIMGWEEKLKNIPNIVTFNKVKRIPILGQIACGDPLFAEENYEGYFVTDPNMLSADFALYARGDSMINANIYEGDLVFFKKTPQVENGAIAAVLIDDEATLKRFKKTDSMVILEPENNEYEPIIITETDNKNVIILGEMVGVYSVRNK